MSAHKIFKCLASTYPSARRGKHVQPRQSLTVVFDQQVHQQSHQWRQLQKSEAAGARGATLSVFPLKKHGLSLTDQHRKSTANIPNKHLGSVFNRENISNMPVPDASSYPSVIQCWTSRLTTLESSKSLEPWTLVTHPAPKASPAVSSRRWRRS